MSPVIGVVVVTVCVVVAAGVGIAGRPRRDRVAPQPPQQRHTRPAQLDLAALGVVPPPAGRLGAILFMRPECAPCSPVKARLMALDQVAVSEIDLAARPEAGADISAVPTLYLIDADGEVVRSWVGEPLKGTLERTVETALGGIGGL